MFNVKGTKLVLFSLLVCVLLTYTGLIWLMLRRKAQKRLRFRFLVFVDAGFMHGHGHPHGHGHVSHNTHVGGNYIPRGHPYGGYHSSSSRSCSSMLLIAGLLIGIGFPQRCAGES